MTAKEYEDSLEFALEWLNHEAKFEIVNPNIPQCARAILAHIANLNARIAYAGLNPGDDGDNE